MFSRMVVLFFIALILPSFKSQNGFSTLRKIKNIPFCAQMSTSVNRRGSVARASATTPLETTRVSAPRTTCRSTAETTAWVRLHAARSGGFSFVKMVDTITFGDLFLATARRHEEELLLQELLL